MSLVKDIYKKHVNSIFKSEEYYKAFNQRTNAHRISDNDQPTTEQTLAFQADVLDFCKKFGFKASVSAPKKKSTGPNLYVKLGE